jgi:hypothetical protein
VTGARREKLKTVKSWIADLSGDAATSDDIARARDLVLGPYGMVTNTMMRFEQELDLPQHPRSEIRNQFIRDNFAELRQRFRDKLHYPGGPTNYRRSKRIKFAYDSEWDH